MIFLGIFPAIFSRWNAEMSIICVNFAEAYKWAVSS